MKTLIRFSIVAFIFAIGYFNPNLNAAMSGDYYVGSNSGPSGPADYSTLSAAFSALETQGKSGDVTFWITSDLSVSSAQDLGVVSGSGTIYIRPYQSERTISGSVSNGGIIEFDGTDDFVVDGSINGSGRHLIIKNNTNGAGIHLNGTSTVYSTDWEIKNCEIFAGGTSSSHNICIALSGSNAYSSGYRHSDGLIENNILKRGYYGIRARAASSLYEMDNIVIKGNVFGDKDDWGSSDRIRYYGIYSYYNEKWDVLDNEMYVERYPMYFRYNYDLVTIKNNIAKGHDYYPYLYFMYDGVDIQDNYFEGSGTNNYGLYVRSNNSSYEPCIISNNEITKSDYYGLYIYYADNVEIENNYIHKIHANTTGYLSGMYLNRVEDGLVKNNRIEDIKNNTTSNYGGAAYGIYVWGGSSSLTYTEDLEIFQNFIKNLRSNGNVQTSTSQFENPIGIYIRGGEDYYIHHNTIDMGTSFNDDSKQGAWSACVLAGYYKTQGIRMKNNILKNDMIGNGTKAYGFALRPYFSGTYSVTEMDHNVYDLTGAGAAGNVVHWNGTDYAFLASWQNDMNIDLNSAQTEVHLMSDGHIDGGSVGDEDLEVPKISGIDHDMDGELRQSTTTAGIDVAQMQPIELTQDMMMDPPSGSVVCPGDQVSMEFAGGTTFADGINRNVSTALEYTWYFEDEDGNTSVINPDFDEHISISFNTLEISEAQLEHAGSYYAMISYPGLESVYTSEVQLGVTEPLSMTSQPMPSYEGCVGKGEIIMQVGAENEQGYIWEKETEYGWQPIEEAPNDDTFVIDLSQFVDDEGNYTIAAEELNGNYRVKVLGSESCPPAYLYSDIIEVQLFDPITNVNMSDAGENYELCWGDNISFTASAEGDFAGYQWQKYEAGSWIDMNPEHNPTVTTPNLVLENVRSSTSGGYRCEIVRLNKLCHEDPVYTDAAYIEVPPIFELVDHPESHIVCENSDVTMYVLGNGIGEIHSYQWYKDGAPVNFPEGTPLEEQKLLRIEGATIDDIGNYYAEVTVEDCRGVQTFTSDVAAVYILEQTEITEQPSSYTAQAGENATFRVEAHMKGIVPPYYQHDFQWYMRTKTTPQVATMLEDGDKYEGAETEELTIMNVEADDYDYEYYVVVTGRCGDPQMSDPVEIMDVPGVTIVSQPESVSICEGSDIDFTVDADPTVAGTQIEYQWFKDGMSLSNDSKYDGVNTNKLVINDIVDSDAGMYYAEIRAVGGNMATTDEAELTVDLMAEITTQPEGLTVKKDESVKLMVEAAGTEPMTYQWYKDGAELAGEESAEFEIRYAEENDAGEYHVAITNVCGTVESQKVTLNVDASIPNSVTEAGGVKIYSNTPNPFNSTTQIKFYLPAAADVSVRITDNFGKDISTLLDDFIGAGEHTVDFESDDHNLSSGVYYFTIAIDGVQHTRRMVLVK